MTNDETRKAFENWFSNEGEYPLAIERSNQGGYKLSAASVGWHTWETAVKFERNRIADWLDSDWPADSSEERYNRAWIATKLRLQNETP